jgi:cell division topological specificity factor
MFEFLMRLFRGEPSGQTAKERLRLVLLSDHLSLSPEIVDALKTDLLAVISRYVEVDEAGVDVTFEQREHEVAMLANIPIRSLKPRDELPKPVLATVTALPAQEPAPAAAAEMPLPKAETEAADAVDAVLEPPAVAEPVVAAEPGVAAEPPAVVPDPEAQPAPAPAAALTAKQRKRRKRRAARAAAQAVHGQPDPVQQPLGTSAQA